jgi:hypothetical protein
MIFSALSFPMQVYTASPYPTLFPYIIIALIGVLTFFSSMKRTAGGMKCRRKGNGSLMINIYMIIILFNTSWQIIFQLITLTEGVTVIVIYLLPIVFFFYFREAASEKEIGYALFGMVVAGLIVGLYFAYDSYLKLALGQVSDYANAAFQYSLDRSGLMAEEANDARARSGFRSFGLLESHSVSGGYVVLSAFAALALLPINRWLLRLILVAIFGTLLLMALNFTSIIAFAVIIFLFEYGGKKILRGRLPRLFLINIILLVCVCALILSITFLQAGDDMMEAVNSNLSFQLSLLLGSKSSGLSMVGLLLANIENYFQHILVFPHTLLVGDGFSSYGMVKGGDIGLVETLAKFGLPLFAVIIFGYFRLIKAGFRVVNTVQLKHEQDIGVISKQGVIQFSICVTLLVFITEGHYSIWSSKTILPIIFFSLALFERYCCRRPKTDPLIEVMPTQICAV